MTGGLKARAADVVDISKLPSPATAKIDFKRDIQPIFENSCLRCHGPEKAKSQFRLDNREPAIKGGKSGVDILPGNSAQSPLIHYVAHLVEDMEMPPIEKGQPLDAKQIGLLRAWIDQGAIWDAAPPTNNWSFDIEPTFGGTMVSGDAAKFREHNWEEDGVNGGIKNFESIQQLGRDTTFSSSGHALRDDYKIVLSLDKNECGFIHSSWEQYRKYYDDEGGYYPAFSPSVSHLGRDLYLDIGKAQIDFGLTLPNWPRMVAGYEYDYRQGEEGTTSWGAVSQGGVIRNIAPASRDLHEGVHIIKFDLDHEIAGITIEERFRGEFYQLKTQTTNNATFFGTTLTQAQKMADGYNYFQGANTIRLEKKVYDWLLVSGGYLYSDLNANSSFSLNTTTFDMNWLVPQINLERSSHVFNLNSLIGPFDGLTLSSGIQNEWTRQKGAGQGNLGVAGLNNLAVTASDYDEESLEENVALRYTKIPFTALFAEVRLQQENIGQHDELADTFHDDAEFLQNTAFSSDLSDLRVGFSTSPLRQVSFTADYRRYELDSHYNNDQLQQPIGFAGLGYPAFIQSRDDITDEAEAKLVLRPCHWLKTSLSYQFSTTDTRMSTAAIPGITPGGQLLSDQYHSQTYSINTILNPGGRMNLSTTVSYGTSTSTTADNGATSIVPYRGHLLTVMNDGTYVLGPTSDLFAGYSFSEADYGEANFAGGLPTGMQYHEQQVRAGISRRFGKDISTKLQYVFSYYDEPSSGGAANYRAHSIFASVAFRLR